MIDSAEGTSPPSPVKAQSHTSKMSCEGRMDASDESCTMLRIDLDEGRVTGASAGHVPLLYARDDGSHSIREMPGGPVLGVLPAVDYAEESFTLARDAALVMVTDGLVEGPGLTLDAGLERAGSLAAQAIHGGLNAEETADRLLDAAVAVDHLDDVVVLIPRLGPAAPATGACLAVESARGRRRPWRRGSGCSSSEFG
ncbi:PP2C family protein-serine/threonine phosphatase [Streptomyces sp. NPDC051014]|uniref:PP2C family protein-serine/threonine phosphatase n=1 Tax=Streptomyces sp. NPDC051014 TaxID=3155751 RepID=UPI0033CAA04C